MISPLSICQLQKKRKNMQNRQISKNCSILHEKAFLDEIGCADENVRN